MTRIALLGDTHITLDTTGEPARYRERFEQVLDDVEAAGVDLVLVTGDLAENGTEEQWSDFRERIARLMVPWLAVPGNHDIGDKRSETKPGSVTEAQMARYEAIMGPAWFAETVGGVRVVGIAASLPGSGLDRERAQWAFLEEALARPHPLPTILLTHYPPALLVPEEPGDPYWNIEPAPRRRLWELLEHGGVRLVLSGHLHRFLVNRFGAVLSVTSPASAFGLPKDRQPRGWTLLQIAGENVHVTPMYVSSITPEGT